MSKARAKTEDEVRNAFLDQLHGTVKYWVEVKRNQEIFPGPEYDAEYRLDGLAFSILSLFDGTNGEWPHLKIVLDPHPDDKEFHKSQGENWFKAGMVINNSSLHDLWYKEKK